MAIFNPGTIIAVCYGYFGEDICINESINLSKDFRTFFQSSDLCMVSATGVPGEEGGGWNPMFPLDMPPGGLDPRPNIINLLILFFIN